MITAIQMRRAGTPRRSFNNIFIAVNPDSCSDHPITFIPSPSFPGPTDGNDYYAMGVTTKDPYRYLGYTYDDEDYRGGYFAALSLSATACSSNRVRAILPPAMKPIASIWDPKLRRSAPTASSGRQTTCAWATLVRPSVRACHYRTTCKRWTTRSPPPAAIRTSAAIPMAVAHSRWALTAGG